MFRLNSAQMQSRSISVPPKKLELSQSEKDIA
jgi:hypothetical protein